MRYIAKIPFEFITNDIKWLAIKPQLHDGMASGYLLLSHTSFEEESKWDTWFGELEHAFEAGQSYGIQQGDWIEQQE